MAGRLIMSKIKNAFWDSINTPNTGDCEPDLEQIMNASAVQPTLEETLEFARDYMQTPEFAKEWEHFKQHGEFNHDR